MVDAIARVRPVDPKIALVIRSLDPKRENAPFAGSNAIGPRGSVIAASINACRLADVGLQACFSDAIAYR